MSVGDMLVTQRSGYTHHGVDIGNGRVIHYSGFANGFEGGKIELTSMWRFRAGRRLVRIKPESRSGSHPVLRGLTRLGEDEYNLIANNCEHFAEWCANGVHRSHQVDRVRRFMREASKSRYIFAASIFLPFYGRAAALSLGALSKAMDAWVEGRDQSQRLARRKGVGNSQLRKCARKLGKQTVRSAMNIKSGR